MKSTNYTNKEVPFLKKDSYAELDNLHLTIPCKKCGRSVWVKTLRHLTWECTHCGNITYFIFGNLVQQIERVMQSDRKRDFMYSEDGKIIVPRIKESIYEN